MKLVCAMPIHVKSEVEKARKPSPTMQSIALVTSGDHLLSISVFTSTIAIQPTWDQPLVSSI